jgi:hypothetical protein
MRSIQFALLIPVVLAVAACAAQNPVRGLRAFTMSSDEGRFTVRGTLSGTIEVQAKQLVIVVNGGTLRAVGRSEASVSLRPMIAGAGEKGKARRVMVGTSHALGPFKMGVPRKVDGPLAYELPLVPDFDAVRQWLVFQFVLTNGNSTYICETNNLLGPEGKGPQRLEENCWTNPQD